MDEIILTALAEVNARKSEAEAKLQQLYIQLHGLQREGIEIERLLLVISGEIKALEGLKSHAS